MIKALKQAASKIEDLVQHGSWYGYYVEYSYPIIERIMCTQEDRTYYIHRLLPCKKEEVYRHMHGWPCAVLVVSGGHDMDIGTIDDDGSYTLTSRHILRPGDMYELSQPTVWHGVQPLEESISMMVVGDVFDDSIVPRRHKTWMDKHNTWLNEKYEEDPIRHLSKGEVDDLLNDFAIAYKCLRNLTKVSS